MSNEEQISHWNGEAGRKWASRDNQMSQLLAPFSDALLESADLKGRRAALEIGCGGGSVSLQLADRLGAEATVVGIDISAPLLEVARQRLQRAPEISSQVDFLLADAATHDFGETRFDLLMSRFGVMFFDAPAAAFEQLRRAALPGGKLAFCCWQPMTLNPFVALPMEAALRVLPAPPAPAPRAPGPFAFSERDYTQEVLERAGWSSVHIKSRHLDMHWANAGTFSDTVREMVNTGPVGGMLADLEQESRTTIYAAAEELLAPYYSDGTLTLDSAVWMVTAENRS